MTKTFIEKAKEVARKSAEHYKNMTPEERKLAFERAAKYAEIRLAKEGV